jgi:hypothetical protein
LPDFYPIRDGHGRKPTNTEKGIMRSVSKSFPEFKGKFN